LHGIICIALLLTKPEDSPAFFTLVSIVSCSKYKLRFRQYKHQRQTAAFDNYISVVDQRDVIICVIVQSVHSLMHGSPSAVVNFLSSWVALQRLTARAGS
jgi:hypothetical protein